MQKSVIQKYFENNYLKVKKYRKVRDDLYNTREYREGAHSIYNLKYSIPKKNSYSFS